MGRSYSIVKAFENNALKWLFKIDEKQEINLLGGGSSKSNLLCKLQTNHKIMRIQVKKLQNPCLKFTTLGTKIQGVLTPVEVTRNNNIILLLEQASSNLSPTWASLE